MDLLKNHFWLQEVYLLVGKNYLFLTQGKIEFYLAYPSKEHIKIQTLF